MNYPDREYKNIWLRKRLFFLAEIIGGFLEKYLAPSRKEKCGYLFYSVFLPDNQFFNLRTFLGFKFLSSVSFAFLAGLFPSFIIIKILIIAAAGISGFFVPDFILKRISVARARQFNNELPYIIDLLCISALSGQNIYNCLKILIEKHKGLATAELARFLSEIDFGVGKLQAYKNICSGSSTEDFKNLLFIILQAEKYGSSISDILKQKSRYLRFEALQGCEMRSRRISIFMLFPLIFLILPAFILLVGAPLVFSMAGSFIVK